MGRKRIEKEEEPQILKTTELKNFINILKEMDKDVSEDIEQNKGNGKNNKRFYLSFNARFLINATLLLVALLMFICSLFLSFSITNEEVIKYNVSSDIDYKVYLKPNEFYDTPYLEKGMAYVSSLINNIKVNYNYKFNISRKSNIDFDYKVIARLVIANKSNSNIFFDKEYKLKEGKVESMKDRTIHVIDEETSVNYSYYNNLANKFRSKYAVDTNSYLEVYLLVNEKNSEESDFKLNNNSKAVLTIPLSMQEVNIALNESDIDEHNQVIADSKVVVKNIGNVIISAVLLIMIIFLNIRFIKKVLLLTNKKSAYDSYIDKLLKGYDRVIVNIKNKPNLEEYNTIKVESFQELIDVRDNFKVPINYYVVTPHQKSEFFCVNNNDVYVYVVKAVDLDKGNKK